MTPPYFIFCTNLRRVWIEILICIRSNEVPSDFQSRPARIRVVCMWSKRRKSTSSIYEKRHTLLPLPNSTCDNDEWTTICLCVHICLYKQIAKKNVASSNQNAFQLLVTIDNDFDTLFLFLPPFATRATLCYLFSIFTGVVLHFTLIY